MKTTWRTKAGKAIWNALQSNPHATRNEASRIIKRAWGTEPRENYPYKAWLLARREMLDKLYPPKRTRMPQSEIGGLFAEERS